MAQPTALLGKHGERPLNEAILAVSKSGRCFDDDANNPLETAELESEDPFSAFNPKTYFGADGTVDSTMQEAFDIAQRVSAPVILQPTLPPPSAGRCFARNGVTTDASRNASSSLGFADDEQEYVATPMDTTGLEFEASFEDVVERGATGFSILGGVVAPCCYARSTIPSHLTCFQCGCRPGWQLQLPFQVFDTAVRRFGEQDPSGAAVDVVVMMATMLSSGKDEEVVQRLAVCNNIDCLLRASLMTPEWRSAWLDGPRRPQEERETVRKDQTVLLEQNLNLFHDLVKKDKLKLLEVQHLMRFLSLNSQFVLEREKRFISTSMAVAEHEKAFGYRFPNPQRFVNRMASLAHGYMLNAIVPHIMDTDMLNMQWQAHLQRLLFTAYPKPPDVVYALLVEAVAEEHGFQRSPAPALHDGFDSSKEEPPFGWGIQTRGRIDHCVPEGPSGEALRKLFEPPHFLERLQACISKAPSYELNFAFSSHVRHANASNPYAALRTSRTTDADGVTRRPQRVDIYAAMRALNDPYAKKLTTTGHGVAELPSSGDTSYETNVHPKLRYFNLWRGLGFDDCDAEDRTALMLDFYHTSDPRAVNGKEMLKSGKGHRSCYILRMPTVTNATITSACASSSRSSIPALAAIKSVVHKRRAESGGLIMLGSKQRQAKLALMQHKVQTPNRTTAVMARVIEKNGNVSLLGTPSQRPEHQGLSVSMQLLARDLAACSTLTESGRAMARVIFQHTNKYGHRGLPIVTDLDNEDWDAWWETRHDAMAASATPAIRTLVKQAHEANDALNAFAETYGLAETKEDEEEEERYLVDDHEDQLLLMHGRPSALHQHLEVLHLATTKTHPCLQELVSSYALIRTFALQFSSAYKRHSMSEGKAAAQPSPMALTCGSVRDQAAHLDAQPSKSVQRAMEYAKRHAEGVWADVGPRLGESVTREDFEQTGPRRAWALQRLKHQDSTTTTSFVDPERRDREAFAATLRRVADEALEHRNKRLLVCEQGIATARKRHEEAKAREAEQREQRAKGVVVAAAMGTASCSSVVPVSARSRSPRVPRSFSIPPAPPKNAEAMIRRSLTAAKRKHQAEHARIDRYLNAEAAAASEPELEHDFFTAMQLKYGSICQQYLNARQPLAGAGRAARDDDAKKERAQE